MAGDSGGSTAIAIRAPAPATVSRGVEEQPATVSTGTLLDPCAILGCEQLHRGVGQTRCNGTEVIVRPMPAVACRRADELPLRLPQGRFPAK